MGLSTLQDSLSLFPGREEQGDLAPTVLLIGGCDVEVTKGQPSRRSGIEGPHTLSVRGVVGRFDAR